MVWYNDGLARPKPSKRRPSHNANHVTCARWNLWVTPSGVCPLRIISIRLPRDQRKTVISYYTLFGDVMIVCIPTVTVQTGSTKSCGAASSSTPWHLMKRWIFLRINWKVFPLLGPLLVLVLSVAAGILLLLLALVVVVCLVCRRRQPAKQPEILIQTQCLCSPEHTKTSCCCLSDFQETRLSKSLLLF